MRIVGGMWRGRALEAPEGRNVTRPTTDRTRESMASMVLSAFDLDLSEVRMLDAFAGSGAIGYELLSRGARSCTFCDADRKAVARIKRNGQALGAAREAHAVVGGDVFTGPKFAIDAIAAGKEAAESLHRFVQHGHMTIGRNRRDFIELNKQDILVEQYDNSSRQDPGVIPTKTKFEEYHGTLTEDQVKKETARCLS